jgi:1-acyl-sn-glycerol-3-phosphate acyltransferase
MTNAPVQPASGPAPVLPATPSAGFARVFGWYARRLLSRRFEAVRLAEGSRAAAASLAGHDGPLLVVLNHASWWDPIVALVAGGALLPGRPAIAPMDRAQLERFEFFRKLGLFGIDPDDPRSLPALVGVARDHFARHPRGVLALTPQGRFTDAREPILLRPGAAAVCATLRGSNLRAVCLSIEYAFWQSQRPEVFIRLDAVNPPPTPSTPGWHRALESAMARSAAELARLVIARDPAAFEPLLERRGASVNPAYDALLRLRGRAGEIAARRTHSSDPTPAGTVRPETAP